MIKSKICTKCKEEKPISEYHKRKNGYKPRCKKCISEDYKEYYYRDHEETKRKKRETWHRCELKKVLNERLHAAQR